MTRDESLKLAVIALCGRRSECAGLAYRARSRSQTKAADHFEHEARRCLDAAVELEREVDSDVVLQIHQRLFPDQHPEVADCVDGWLPWDAGTIEVVAEMVDEAWKARAK